MRPEVKINGAVCDLIERSLTLNVRLGKNISTAEFDIEGEEYSVKTPRVAIARVVSYKGYTRPNDGDTVEINRGAVPMVNCAIVPAVAMGGKSTYLNEYFGGYVAMKQTNTKGFRRRYHLNAQDYNVKTTRKLVTKSYSSKTYKQFVDDLFSSYLPQFDTSEVEDTVATASIDWTDMYFDQCMDEVSKIFGKIWYIKHDLTVQAFTPVDDTAPFILSDEPFGTTSLGYYGNQHTEDGTQVIKKVKVNGDGVTETVTKGDDDDDEYESKYEDTNIDTSAWAQSVGQAIIDESGQTKIDGTLTFDQEGLELGQKVKIINRSKNINDYYLVRSVTLRMLGGDQEQVSIEYGDGIETVEDRLAKIKRLEQKET